MKIKDILQRNSSWLILSSLCSIIISCSVVFGTNVIAEQIDRLTALSAIDVKNTFYIVGPAVLIAVAASFVKSKCIGRYSIQVVKEIQEAIVQQMLKVREERKSRSMKENKFAKADAKCKNEFEDRESTGRLLATITSDIAEIEKYTSATVPDFIHAVFSILFVAVYVGIKNLHMLLITASLYPVIILIMTFWGNILKRLAQKRRGNIDAMVEQVVDCVNGMEIVKSYNLSQIFMAKIEGRINEILDNEYKRAWIMHFSQTLQRFLFCIPNMICPFIAFQLVLRKEITIGEMMAYIVLIHKIIANMKQLPFLITDAKEKKVSIDRMNQIWKVPVRKENPVRSLSEDGIRLENVSFGYIEGKEALKNINFFLKPHKTYAFVGMSGQGKSTLFRLLSGLEEEYDGKCSIPEKCGMVSQTPFLFAGTIAENIGIGCEGATMEDIVKAAKDAGIHEKIESLEDKYHTLVGENGTGLSGGEKQRICIARALVSGADVLLFDEPTASVDAETEKIILNTLEQLKGKKTILLISHKMSFLQNADTIFVIDGGEIVEQGRHENLILSEGVYKRLWKTEVCHEV